MPERPRSWTANGHRYWQLRTAAAEIVASMPESYTPYFPPKRAKYEVYTLSKNRPPRFLGYLREGPVLDRVHRVFSQTFAR